MHILEPIENWFNGSIYTLTSLLELENIYELVILTTDSWFRMIQFWIMKPKTMLITSYM